MKVPSSSWPLAAVLSVTLGGCASVDNATFVTKTAISVVDADAAPASASIGFDRIEAYVGPRLPDGKVYPVVAAVQSTGAGMARSVQQSFAGGDAALRVIRGSDKGAGPAKGADKPNGTGDANAGQPGSAGGGSISSGGTAGGGQGGSGSNEPLCGDNRKPPLIFGTTTNIGLKLGFADGTVLPSSFNFGYRRKEAALVPVTERCQPSVLAYAQNEGSVGAGADAAARSKAGLDVTQYFATGAAADELAGTKEVQDGFMDRAAAALGGVAAFEDRERQQGRLTVDIFSCLERLDPVRMRQIIEHGTAMQLYADKAEDNKTQGATIRGGADATDAQRRKDYMGAMSAQLAQRGVGDTRTANLRTHREVVCALAARQPS